MEGAGGTDKALGEPELSRPMARAAATPSTGVCAPPMCRHPCTSALTRMLAYHIRLFLGRLFYTLKGYGVEFTHPKACRKRARLPGSSGNRLTPFALRAKSVTLERTH